MKLNHIYSLSAFIVLLTVMTVSAEAPRTYDFLTSEERTTLDQIPYLKNDLLQEATTYRKDLAQMSDADEKKIVEITKKMTTVIQKILEAQAALSLINTLDNADNKQAAKHALDAVKKDVDALKEEMKK